MAGMGPDGIVRSEVLADAGALARRVAEWLTAAAVEKDGAFAVCLSGGSTPELLYKTLAEAPFRGVFPWAWTHWFWGDERFVPADDARSNFAMVQRVMFDHAPVPKGHIHRMPTEGLSPQDAAAAYARELAHFYGADRLDPARPLFDVTLLGLGADGHTASLFPGSPALEETGRWVDVVTGQAETRITLTYPVLESSARIGFLVSGAGKRAILSEVRGGSSRLPAARVRTRGEVVWFADEAAAG